MNPRPFRRTLAPALRRTSRQIATHLRTLLVNRAKKLPPTRRIRPHLQRRAMSARAHLHVSAIPDEVRHAFRINAKPVPIGARDAHVGIQIGMTTHSATEAVGDGDAQAAPAGHKLRRAHRHPVRPRTPMPASKPVCHLISDKPGSPHRSGFGLLPTGAPASRAASHNNTWIMRSASGICVPETK